MAWLKKIMAVAVLLTGVFMMFHSQTAEAAVSPLRIGYHKHWTRPDYCYFDFLKEQGYNVQVVDCQKENYLEKFDVFIIEQNGFNDYVENDEIYIHDWVKRGGILIFMHQNYQRWVPTFLPPELGFTQLIHRHVPTLRGVTGYLMPWVDAAQTDLFTDPEKIDPTELIYWSIFVGQESYKTTAFSCFLPDSKVWNVLGDYKDPAVKDGALIMEAKYGKGLVYLNQILFPERKDGGSEKIFTFWEKYTKNILAHCEKFRKGEAPKRIAKRGTLPLKKNYNLALHVHSLDWYCAHASIGTLYAALREYHYDAVVLAVKDSRLFNGNLHLERYSDEHILFLPGQEYHPFNFGCSSSSKHSNYHTITVGVPEKDITFEFTKTIYSDAQGEKYLQQVVDFVHSKGGVAGATHVFSDVWRKPGYDMVDLAPLRPLQGTDIEKHWLDGNRITLVNSIDMWGVQRLTRYPAGNFIYTDGIPTRESIIDALRKGHVVTGTFFRSADVTWGDKLPGDTLTPAEGVAAELRISAGVYEMQEVGELLEIRVFAGAKLIRQFPCKGKTCAASFRFSPEEVRGVPFLRVEVLGTKENVILASNPFYLKDK